jgi:hypothetical protein
MYLIKFYLAAYNFFTTRIYFFYLLGKKINVSPPLYLQYVFTLREPNIETNVRRRYDKTNTPPCFRSTSKNPNNLIGVLHLPPRARANRIRDHRKQSRFTTYHPCSVKTRLEPLSPFVRTLFFSDVYPGVYTPSSSVIPRECDTSTATVYKNENCHEPPLCRLITPP